MLKALDVALSSDLQSVKLNVVIVKDLNDVEVPDFVEMTREKDVSVRFIEFMPITGSWRHRLNSSLASDTTPHPRE